MSEIKDYFLIGDLHTSALVSKFGSIDWFCSPHFDDSTIFAKILDKKAGEFSIDKKNYSCKANYIKNTAIVENVFSKNSSEDSFKVKDFMVPQSVKNPKSHFLIRKLSSLSGNHLVKLYYKPMLNYGKISPKIIFKENSLIINLKNKKLILHLPQDSKIEKKNNFYYILIKLKEKETKEIIFEHCKNSNKEKNKDYEKETLKFWNKWISKGKFFNFCSERLKRSAITLKLMQFYPTGALIAAPTFGLPESIKGNRNWDYRYSWTRDATFTLYAFKILGYKEEANKFFNFIESVSQECKECGITLRLFYTINGLIPPKEETLNYLSGYKNSKPVRIGNDAKDQFQLDVYGVLIDSYYFMLSDNPKKLESKKEIIFYLMNQIIDKWKQKDSGIWEFRDKIENYTYSKVMAWVGINRAIRICDILKIPKDKKQDLIKAEKEIKDWIWENCYDKKNEKLLQYPGSKYQDSTNLLFVLLQFLDKKDLLTKKIIKKTLKEILYKDIFVYRYKRDDEFKGKEGAFILCTFWMISALSIIGEVDKAEKIFNDFEKILNNKGLISEEIEPTTGEYLGNYPQAFSHLGYIMSAYYIDRYKKRK